MKKHPVPNGYIVPIITPFTKDQQVDEEAFRKNIEFLIEIGVAGIAVAGSNGEFPLLSKEEIKRLFELAVEQIKGRVRVIAGTGTVSTREVIELSKKARELGMDALMIITPYYLTPTNRELVAHYKAISDAVDLPIYVYNNPKRTCVNVTPKLLLELAEIKNVVAIKESGSDYFQLTEMLRIMKDRDDFTVIGGKEIWAFSSIVMGTCAVYGVSPLVLGKRCIEMFECVKNNDIAGGRNVQQYINIFRAVIDEVDATIPAVIKEAMNLVGRNGGFNRMPISSLTPSDRERLANVLKSMGLSVSE